MLFFPLCGYCRDVFLTSIYQFVLVGVCTYIHLYNISMPKEKKVSHTISQFSISNSLRILVNICFWILQLREHKLQLRQKFQNKPEMLTKHIYQTYLYHPFNYTRMENERNKIWA